ncbi:MAG TPA: hypothetical protein VF575_02110 [Candidatus Saccharimonadales bacterium]|jgi:hypothetical protein
MKRTTINQHGFMHLAAGVVVLVLIVVGFIGLQIFRHDTAGRQLQAQPSKRVTSFDGCKQDRTNTLVQSTPQQCVTADGTVFTDNSITTLERQYLVIKEWGVRIPLSEVDSGASYAFHDSSPTDQSILTITATNTEQIIGPTGKNCGGEYLAYVMRMPIDDPRWQETDAMPYNEHRTVGKHMYGLATKKQYGPACFATTTTGDYEVDQVTAEKFHNVVKSFSKHFIGIEAVTQ